LGPGKNALALCCEADEALAPLYDEPPKLSSSCLMPADRVGCVTLHAVAARAKCRSCARATMYSRYRTITLTAQQPVCLIKVPVVVTNGSTEECILHGAFVVRCPRRCQHRYIRGEITQCPRSLACAKSVKITLRARAGSGAGRCADRSRRCGLDRLREICGSQSCSVVLRRARLQQAPLASY
jgi:hypothetical protein